MNNIIVKVEIVDQDKKVKILKNMFQLAEYSQGFDVPVLIDERWIMRGWTFRPWMEEIKDEK